MLKNISNHTHLSRITLDYQEENSGRRSWFPHLRKTPEKIYHMEGKRYLSALPKFSSSIPLCEHFSSDFLSTTPAFMPLDSWTAESDGPQPILTGGRNEGGSPSSGSSFGSLLPGLTSHVRQKSTESNISFPFSSFGNNSSPGWNRRSHFRHVTKWFLCIYRLPGTRE